MHSSSPADSVTLRLLGAVIMLLTAAMLLGTKQRLWATLSHPSRMQAVMGILQRGSALPCYLLRYIQKSWLMRARSCWCQHCRAQQNHNLSFPEAHLSARSVCYTGIPSSSLRSIPCYSSPLNNYYLKYPMNPELSNEPWTIQCLLSLKYILKLGRCLRMHLSLFWRSTCCSTVARDQAGNTKERIPLKIIQKH